LKLISQLFDGSPGTVGSDVVPDLGDEAPSQQSGSAAHFQDLRRPKFLDPVNRGGDPFLHVGGGNRHGVVAAEPAGGVQLGVRCLPTSSFVEDTAPARDVFSR